MATTVPRPVIDAGPEEHPPARLVRRRRPLPNGRAVLGGLLVAASAVGLYSAYRSAATPELDQRLVARREIPAGRVIVADDLGMAPVNLTEGIAGRTFESAGQVVGRRALVTIGSDDLLTPSLLSAGGDEGAAASRRVTLKLEAARALDGELDAGELVDVVATDATARTTRVVARGAMVAARPGTDRSGIGNGEQLRVTLLVPDEATAVAIVAANSVDDVALVGSSSVRLPDNPDPPRFEPAPTTTAAVGAGG